MAEGQCKTEGNKQTTTYEQSLQFGLLFTDSRSGGSGQKEAGVSWRDVWRVQTNRNF